MVVGKAAVAVTVVGYVDGLLVYVVAGEPAALTVEFAIPPAGGVAIVDPDDLASLEGEAGCVVGVEVVERDDVFLGLDVELVFVVGQGGSEAGLRLGGGSGGPGRHGEQRACLY